MAKRRGKVKPCPNSRGLLGFRITEVPVADKPDVAAGGNRVAPRGNLADAVEERSLLWRCLMMNGLEKGLVVPTRRNPCRKECFRLPGEVLQVASLRVIERLDPESVSRREQPAFPAVPQNERELAMEVLEASKFPLLV